MHCVRLTELERRLLALVPSDGTRATTRQLVERFYGGAPPVNAGKIVVGRLRGIALKLPLIDHPQRIRKSKRAGPNPIEFWLADAPSAGAADAS